MTEAVQYPTLGDIVGALAILTFCLRTINRAWRARLIVDKDYSERRSKARGVLETRSILPQLVDLVFEVGSATGSSFPPDEGEEEELRSRVRTELERADYLFRLDDLAELGADRQAIDRLPERAIRWATFKGLGAILALLGLIYPGYRWFTEHSFGLDSNWGRASLILVVIGALIAAVTWARHTALEKRLSKVLGKYE